MSQHRLREIPETAKKILDVLLTKALQALTSGHSPNEGINQYRLYLVYSRERFQKGGEEEEEKRR